MSDEDEEKISVADLEEVNTELYSAQDVANIFRVSTKTVSRWSKPGGNFEIRNVQILNTIGGHKRYYQEEIHQLFQLMLEGRLYPNEDVKPNNSKADGPSRIAGLPKVSTIDPRLQ
jgi:transposase